MSMHQLMRYNGFRQDAGNQKRFLHRSPDYRYLEIWKKSQVHFQEHYSNIYFYPKLVHQILRTTATSKMKGFVPFIHAMPSSLRVMEKLWEIESPDHKGLRSPQSFYATRSFEEALREIPSELERSRKPGILSMSYALTCGSKHCETAASWGFANHFKKMEISFCFAEELATWLKAFGLARDSYFTQKGRWLIHEYAQLEVGDFLVLNIPPKMVSRYVIDSHPYNVPTGRQALDVAFHPESYEKDLLEEPKTHMASLVLCKDTLGPSSPLSIIHANSSSEVDDFCEGVSLRPMQEIEVFDGLASPLPTHQEEEYLSRRKVLDGELETYAELFKAYLHGASLVLQVVPEVSFWTWDGSV